MTVPTADDLVMILGISLVLSVLPWWFRLALGLILIIVVVAKLWNTSS